MPVIFASLFRPVTYSRWLHLLIGWVFAGVVLLVYPGTEGLSVVRVVVLSAAVDSVLLTAVAMIPAMRRAEGVQARLLLVPEREESIGAAPSASWRDRARTALWLIARVGLGFAVGMSTVGVLTFGASLVRPSVGTGALLLPVLAFALLWLVVFAGRLQLWLAQKLLGPSAAERLAEAELRAERLLERNRLARELHDSIGHALTVTVLQAGAAREVADPAFRERALEAIETVGRRAMEDLERMLVLLREAPDAVPAEQPGIDRVGELLEGARAAGSPIEADVAVRGAELPGVLSREAYRIVQEGVTNALKHAPGAPIRVRARVEDETLVLSCRNVLVGGGRKGGGKGLRGIRERAVLLGGDATSEAVDGEWVLRVRLPVRLAG
ncbi:sensor histidine kinase [Kitasatospora sp. NPDC048365]|uniref:sensor histidine kinase n=1 Tax=Kitasatospora sp. NPDC048365 TaxID=3364050 RepID=UPI0037108F3A